MSRGLILDTSFQPSPSRSMTPGRKFCTSTSAFSRRRRATARPSGFFKSSVRLRWFLCARRKKTLTPLRKRLAPDQCRSQSVPPGGSILTTSAPMSARNWTPDGPSRNWVKERTRMPARTLSAGPPLAALGGAGDAREGLSLGGVALDDLVVDRDRVADEERGGEADLVVAVGDPRARQPLEDLRRGVGHEPEGERAVGDAPPVPGLAHVLLVHVVGREVTRDAGEEVDVRFRDGLAEADAASDRERFEAVLARCHVPLLTLAREEWLTVGPGAGRVKPSDGVGCPS